MTKIGEKSGTVKWESKIRMLKDGNEHMGMAIDASTNEEWPAKLVQAVKVGADVPGVKGTEKTIADSKRQKYREAFQPFSEPAKEFLRSKGGKATFSELGTFLVTVEGVPTKWGPELKKATSLTSRSMLNPFLESFLDDFSIEAVGQTYSAILVEAAGTETAQPARRRLTKKQTANAAPKLMLARTAEDTTKRTTTRTIRTLK
jgi:hypothetical protein